MLISIQVIKWLRSYANNFYYICRYVHILNVSTRENSHDRKEYLPCVVHIGKAPARTGCDFKERSKSGAEGITKSRRGGLFIWKRAFENV